MNLTDQWPFVKIGIILYLGFVAWLTIALFSFSSNDSSWLYNDTSSTLSLQNWAGTWGAWAASFCIAYLGEAAFLLIPLLVITHPLLVPCADYKAYKNRYCGLLLLIISSSMLMAHHKVQFFLPSVSGSGGMVGYYLITHLSAHEPYLVQIFFCCIVWIALILAIGVQWVPYSWFFTRPSSIISNKNNSCAPLKEKSKETIDALIEHTMGVMLCKKDWFYES